jgi:alpha-tubulin suppressor-like RCC1 family protein
VLGDGSARCWGRNEHGELGDGSTYSSHVPVPVSDITGAIRIAASRYHTCATLVDGSARCWGSNDYGQLGNGSLLASLIPVPVSDLTGAVAIAVGFRHTCAVLGDGAVRCWGSNDAGQLGIGNSWSTVPVPVTGSPFVERIFASGFE